MKFKSIAMKTGLFVVILGVMATITPFITQHNVYAQGSPGVGSNGGS
jgi:hypothetical protein